ncbi:hypothetical protein KM043_018885, partial [Ampulex compressa]
EMPSSLSFLCVFFRTMISSRTGQGSRYIG